MKMTMIVRRPALPMKTSMRSAISLGLSGCPGCTPGSNEWVHCGAHTASGKPLLSNDMHLGPD